MKWTTCSRSSRSAIESNLPRASSEVWQGELSDFVTLRDACCPECNGDLVELPHGAYSIREGARGCGWWDETRPAANFESDQTAARIDLVPRQMGNRSMV